MAKRFNVDHRHFTVCYAGPSTDNLTTGEYYYGYFNESGGLVVLNNNRKWNKYGTGSFVIPSPRVIRDEVTHRWEELALITSTANVVAGTGATKASVTTTSSGYIYSGPTTASTVSPSATVKTFIIDTSKVDVPKEKKEVRTMAPSKPNTLTAFLNEQGVTNELIKKIQEFRSEHKIDSDDTEILDRINKPDNWYVGSEWPLAISAILAGKNILLEGDKATGKNVFADSLAFLFGRPIWDISCHTNTNAESLIGGETFKDGQVSFKPGSVYNVAQYGGFGVLDEINMAKADALAVLHSVTDRRRVLDVPGYQRLNLNAATRFIGTMNSGYAGTRELNEALVSRFVVIHVNSMQKPALVKHLTKIYPGATSQALLSFSQLFVDLQTKAKNAEISTKCVDLRGLQDALDLVEIGAITPYHAVEACIINKAFDEYEKNLVRDVVNTLVPKTWTTVDVFTRPGSISVTF